MKIRPFLTRAATLAAAFLLASCGLWGSKSDTSTSAPGQSGAQSGSATASGTSRAQPPVGTPAAQGGRMHPLDDPNSALSKRSVYFEFDRSDVKAEYRPLVEAHARYLRDNPNARITVEGNCDERGSREYNVALGQRRAENVKKAMQLLGARDQQIEAVSFGEEKPKAAGHDDAAWSQNRRDDVVYNRRP